jgi:hypothetical protein
MPEDWSKPGAALDFVQRHGVVLESGRGPVPSLANAIAGTEIRGSWWGHARGKEIFRATRAVRDSDDVLVCKLIGGKITYVHRRLWPALVRIADTIPAERLAAIREEHTSSGAHRSVTTPFRDWLSPAVKSAAGKLSEAAALAQFGDWLQRS